MGTPKQPKPPPAVAPWPDSTGATIRDGHNIQMPDGRLGIACFVPGVSPHPWRVRLDGDNKETKLKTALQLGGLVVVKLCGRCAQTKPSAAFATHPKHRDGMQPYCRACQKDLRADWADRNREKIQQGDRDRRKAARIARNGPTVTDGASAQIFPDISEADQALGRVALQKLAAHVDDPGIDNYLGGNTIRTRPPGEAEAAIASGDGSPPARDTDDPDPSSASPPLGEGGDEITKKKENDAASTPSTHASEDAASAAKTDQAAFGGSREDIERLPALSASPTVAMSTNTAGFADLPHAAIVLSKTNPRTHFDQAFLQELAADIRAKGVLQPILVRPLPGSRLQETLEDLMPGQPRPTHEVVAGEQRWRAAGIAGLQRMPAMIRQLTDDEVLDIQLVENLKRRDLHPLEEAEGYERLVERGNTVAQVAERIGKGESYVYNTLSLRRLIPEAREAFFAGPKNGGVGRSVAELIARHTDTLQAAILKDVRSPDHLGEGMSFRKAKAHIENTYMLQLKTAAFKTDDAQLLPAAGTCQACPKRSGSNPDLFGDFANADTCTDPPCFRNKTTAHYAAIEKAAEARGQTVIVGKEAREIMPDSRTLRGYTRVDELQPVDGGGMKSLRGVLGEDLPTPTLLEDPTTHEMIEVLPTAEAGKLLRDKAAPKPAQAKPAEAGTDARQLADAYEKAWRTRAVRAIADQALDDEINAWELGEKILRNVACLIVTHLQGPGLALVAELANAGKVAAAEGIAAHLRAVPADALMTWIHVLMAAQDLQRLDKPAANIELSAAEFLIELKPMQAIVKKDMKAEAAAKAAPPAAVPAAKPARKARTPAPTPEEFNAQVADQLRDQGSLNAFKPDERVRIKGVTSRDGATYSTLGMHATVLEASGERAWRVQPDHLNFPLTLDYTEIEPL